MDEQQQQPQPQAGAGPVVREEAARQLVALAGGLAFVVAAVAVERKVSQPDFYRTLSMKAARVTERAAMAVAKAAALVADVAERVYRQGCA